ncbi:MAG: FHA domain-containing protein [Eubacterium sp.]|nr:FHA domain-containing protein [Eubacterium sp.]
MIEAKYYKDHQHNYMILQCEKERMISSYQHKILTSDKIGEILRCSVRHINGATYYYYDISSKMTLDGMYRNKKMSYGQVKDVLLQLYGICDKLAGYFMEEENLVLEPEHIYYDMTNNKYIGLYYPDYRERGTDLYRPLMDFLLEHIDTEDTGLTENMYQIYEMAEEKHFCIEDALRVLEQGEETVQESIRQSTSIPVWEVSSEAVIDEEEIYDAAEALQTKVPQIDKTGREKHGKKRLFYPVFMIVSLLGIAAAQVVSSMYELAQEEQFALYGSMAAMGVCLVVCLIGIVSGRKKNPSGKTGMKREAEQNTEEGMTGNSDGKYFVDEEMMSLEHVINRDMSLEMAEDKPAAHQSARYHNISSHDVRSSSLQENENCGNTVFFDVNKMEEYKLYAVDRKNKRHIELKQFPYTIGKMAGCVDYVLSDDSVSRIHARFDKQGEKILMTDMNSTNGTYKNGLRMQPQETVEIEPGDEIRFGSLNYCYR